MKKKKIFLLGLMGSGKTTVGRLLARRLGWIFFDTDGLIEKKAGLKIRAIFAKRGEAGFRRLEAQALRRVSRHPSPAVISTGGGAPTLAANRTVMRMSGLRVYLQVPLELIFKRLKKSGLKKRPLLVAGGFAALRGLARERATAYGQSEMKVRALGKPDQVADRILRQIKRTKPDFLR